MPSSHLILCRPLSSCPQSLPASGSFPMSQFFTSGGQSIRVSASASVLPMNIRDWLPFRLTGWISWGPSDSQESFPTPQFKNISSLALNFIYSSTLTSIHDYWKNHRIKELKLHNFNSLKLAIGKGQFSFQSQRKAMPKNAQTTAQLHSSHMLAK